MYQELLPHLLWKWPKWVMYTGMRIRSKSATVTLEMHRTFTSLICALIAAKQYDLEKATAAVFSSLHQWHKQIDPEAIPMHGSQEDQLAEQLKDFVKTFGEVEGINISPLR